MTARHLIVALLGSVVPLFGTFAQSPVVDGRASDVWIVSEAGELRASYSLGGVWTIDAAVPAPGQAEIFFDGGKAILQGVDATSRVLVNRTAGNLPVPMLGLPEVTLAGLGRASNVLGAWADPTLTIDPAGGSFRGTIAVTLRGHPPPKAPGIKVDLHWRINGGTEQVMLDTAERRLFLYQDGVTVIEAWARTGGVESVHRTATFSLAVGKGSLRDTDGDGIPDAYEIENGANHPLESDARLDSDGDGWTDFEEQVRGSDPASDASVPLDTDGDGWSDWDEERRGTDPKHVLPAIFARLSSQPRARTREAPEYLLTGLLYEDAGEVTLRGGWEDLYAAEPGGAAVWSQRDLPLAPELAAAGLTYRDLAEHWRTPLVETELVAGRLPILRVPAGSPLVVSARATPEPGPPTFERWIVKTWVPALPRVTLHGVIPWATTKGLPLATVADWQAAYVAYLEDQLVIPLAIALSPASGVGVALVEGAAAHFSQTESENVAVLLGEPDAAPAVLAIGALRESLVRAVPGRSLDALHADLISLIEPAEVLAGFASTVHALYTADSATLAPWTTTQAAAALLQGDPLDDDPLARYVARLLAVTEIAGLSAAERALLLDPQGDFDVDGLANADEREPPPQRAHSPVLVDSDGDHIPDALDPCPASVDPLCPAMYLQSADSDGDGIMDAIDNCKDVANPGQEDTVSADGAGPDGIGDACGRLANIVIPSTDLRVYAGTEIAFRARASAPQPPVASKIVMRWLVDSTEMATGADVTLSLITPGFHVVELSATRLFPKAASVDQRTVEVVGSLPVVDANGPYAVVEGQPLTLSAAGMTPHVGRATYTWTFGDGATGSGASTSHAWTSNDGYIAEVTYTDPLGLAVTDRATVNVSDSVPEVDFRVEPSGGAPPLTVTFTDLSTAHDGVSSRVWDFGDGSPEVGGAVVKHEFTFAGTFDVTLTVQDGDGSVGSHIIEIEMDAKMVEIPMLPPLAYGLLAGLLLVWRLVGRGHS